MKAPAGTLGAGVGLAQEAPHNLAKRPGAVRAAGVAATASQLFAEKVRPAHQVTEASSCAAGPVPRAKSMPRSYSTPNVSNLTPAENCSPTAPLFFLGTVCKLLGNGTPGPIRTADLLLRRQMRTTMLKLKPIQ